MRDQLTSEVLAQLGVLDHPAAAVGLESAAKILKLAAPTSAG
jgi:hypothetical protein